MRDVEQFFMDEIKRESNIRALTDDFSVVDLVNNIDNKIIVKENE